MFKIGDSVAVLHDTIKGKVVEIGSQLIKIEDQDGFIRNYPANKLVLQPKSHDYSIDIEHSIKDYEDVNVNSIPKIIATASNIVPEIDLHIEELRERHTYLTNFEIVQIQMSACRAFVTDAMNAKHKRIIIIHGKGEGVLKSEIRSYLDKLSKEREINLEYYDASFQKYGQGGATEITFY
jgi:hypothetical protein